MPSRCAEALPIFNVDGLRTPKFLLRSNLVLKSTIIGSRDGEPPEISTALDNLAVPLVSTLPFCRLRVSSRSRTPPSPMEEVRKPVDARSRERIATLASIGVSEAFARSMGPTVPSKLNLPPPGRFEVTKTGNL